MSKLKILVTNDDGIQAAGIRYLYQALIEIADVTVVAPLTQQSGIGIAMTLHRPLHLYKLEWELPSSHVKVWSVDGTPADCVKIATQVVLQSKPDFIISGINHSSNAGRNILYSGTIGAIMEGIMQGIPGIAFSSLISDEENFKKIQTIIPRILLDLTDHHCEGTLFNINFPCEINNKTRIKIAAQGLGFTFQKPVKIEENKYMLTAIEKKYPEKENSDVYLLDKNFITCVPINIFDLTNHKKLKTMADRYDAEDLSNYVMGG